MTREPVISARPQSLPSETWEKQVACGLSLFIIISQDPNCFEIELHLGKGGTCQQGHLECIANCLTRMRRDRDPISQRECIKSFDGIKCTYSGPYLRSCAQVIADTLRDFWGRRKRDE